MKRGNKLLCSVVYSLFHVNQILGLLLLDTSKNWTRAPVADRCWSAVGEVTPASKFISKMLSVQQSTSWDALQGPWLELKCHWCGRVGHDKGSCWQKRGACLIWGSANHRLRQCVRYICLPIVCTVFPPWCNNCRSNHWVKDWQSVYGEGRVQVVRLGCR